MAVQIYGGSNPGSPDWAGFDIPLVPSAVVDADSDGYVDWPEPGGNQVFIAGRDPDNPAGGVGLPWNASQIWVDYETPLDLAIGETNHESLVIDQGSELRWQTLSIGRGAPARAVVSGPGSLFNNDPTRIPNKYSVPIRLGAGATTPAQANTPLLNMASAITITNGVPLTPRSVSTPFDVLVGPGDAGDGRFEMVAGGIGEVGNALVVGSTTGGRGATLVSGAGSLLHVGALVDPSWVHTAGRLTVEDAAMATFVGALGIDGELRLNDSADLAANVLWLAPGSRSRVEGGASRVAIDGVSGTDSLAASGLAPADAVVSTPSAAAAVGGHLAVVDGSLELFARDATRRVEIQRVVRFADNAATGESRGVVELADGRLDVPNGLTNNGVLLATRGRCRVSGAFTNGGAITFEAPDDGDSETTPATVGGFLGIVVVMGQGTSLVFEGPVQNDGIIVVGPGASVSFAGGFRNTGRVYEIDSCPGKALKLDIRGDRVMTNGGKRVSRDI